MPGYDRTAADVRTKLGPNFYDRTSADVRSRLARGYDRTAADVRSLIWQANMNIPAYGYPDQYLWTSAATKTLLQAIGEPNYYDISSFSTVSGSAFASYSIGVPMPYGMECWFVLCLETNGVMREIASWQAARYSIDQVITLGGAFSANISTWVRTSSRFALRVYGQSYNGGESRINLTGINRFAVTAT